MAEEELVLEKVVLCVKWFVFVESDMDRSSVICKPCKDTL